MQSSVSLVCLDRFRRVSGNLTVFDRFWAFPAAFPLRTPEPPLSRGFRASEIFSVLAPIEAVAEWCKLYIMCKASTFFCSLDGSFQNIQLESYAKTEEAKVEELIKAVAESGAKVIVSGGSIGEMAQHFCERYKLMVLKVSSKFELRRFCRTTGAVAILKLSQPNPDDLGYVDSVSVEEIGGATVQVTIVKNEGGGNSVSTVVLRGSTDSILDDLERAVDDGVNTYKSMCRDSRIVPGAAAAEIELARKLKEFSFKETGLDQYAIAKFSECFEMIPKTLAENAGLNAMEIISSLYAEHSSGNTKVGVDLEEGACKDASAMGVWDLHITKLFALKYASDAACTVLRVDQIIMAKPAGGPRRDQAPAPMDED